MSATGISASHRIPNVIVTARTPAMCQKVQGRFSIGASSPQASFDGGGEFFSVGLSRKKRKQSETQQQSFHVTVDWMLEFRKRTILNSRKQRISNQLKHKIEMKVMNFLVSLLIPNFRV
jgi:hypothetical protein